MENLPGDKERKNILKRFFHGVLFSLSIILPGISGGTVLLVFGFYERVLADLVALRIRPYITFGIGTLTGLFLWAFFFQKLITSYPPLVYSFLLGALWASAPLVLKHNAQTLNDFLFKKIVFLLLGILSGWLFAIESPAGLLSENPQSLLMLFGAGAISSATMLIPGISGSAVLLVLGLYDDVLQILTLAKLVSLLVFAAGCTVGIWGLARVLLLLCRRYQMFFSFFTAGLILGSGRALFPPEINLMVILFAVCGAIMVSLWGRRLKSAPLKSEIN